MVGICIQGQTIHILTDISSSLEIYGIWFEEGQEHRRKEAVLLQDLSRSCCTAVESLKVTRAKIAGLTSGKTALRKKLVA